MLNSISKYITDSLFSRVAVMLEDGYDDSADYIEKLAANYIIDPLYPVVSTNSTLFEPKKALAMLLWYIKGNRFDHSICEAFEEYKPCVDFLHLAFNSNYGFYAFKQGYLDLCVERLKRHNDTRQAMFCINNNEAMGDKSIDKLCTNTIQFFIRDNQLDMIVQMRSSNFVTLLPYDAFMFSYFYWYVYNKLTVNRGLIYMQTATLHFYKKNVDKLEEACVIDANYFNEAAAHDKNWENRVTEKLIKNINLRTNENRKSKGC